MAVTAIVVLALLACLTSTLAAVIGLGGGMLMIAILPFFLPAGAIIPVHGVTQLASNLSRWMLDHRRIAWALLPAFIAGAVLGAVFAGLVYVRVPTEWLPPIIGVYILLHVWWPTFAKILSRFENMAVMGFLLTALGIFVGAPGPILMPLLQQRLADHHAVVVTLALFMSLGHAFKLVVFLLAGFDFLEYGFETLALLTGAVLGSVLGTRLRHRIDGAQFKTVLRWVLSLLAARMVVSGFVELPF